MFDNLIVSKQVSSFHLSSLGRGSPTYASVSTAFTARIRIGQESPLHFHLNVILGNANLFDSLKRADQQISSTSLILKVSLHKSATSFKNDGTEHYIYFNLWNGGRMVCF